MFRKLNLFLKVDIYNEPNFFVKKIDDTHYMIGSSNGLRSFVTFHDRIMFVKVLQTDDSLASRYCTPMNDVNMSYADFVIIQAKKTIHLHIQKKYIYNFVFFNFNSFLNKNSSQSEIAESYWGTLEQARSFSNSFDDGIILQADIDENDLKASILMAESLYDSGDLDEIPDEDDIDFSIENLGGCVCLISINDFSVVVQE